MRQFTGLIVSLLLGLVPHSSPPEAAARSPIDSLAWLAGCWASVGAENGSGEQWTRPAGGTMLGTNRTVKGGSTVAWEFLRIRDTEEGGVELVAQPGGRSGTAFTMTAQSESSATFENPEHDFPQRIIYSLKEGDLLRARVEGEVEGELKGADVVMRRVDCESGE